MRISKIKTVLKYNKTSLPILRQGVQISSNKLLFTNLETYVLLDNLDEVGSTFGIDKELFKTNQIECKEDFIKVPEHYESVTTFKPSQEFKEKIKRLLNFAGNDDLRPVMKGICLTTNFITATDAHILSDLKHDLVLPGDFECILPRDLCEFLIEADSFSISEKIEGAATFKLIEVNLTIEGKKAKVISRAIDGNYPKYKGVIPENYEYNKCIELDAKKLKDLITESKRVSKECIVSFNEAYANLYKPTGDYDKYDLGGKFNIGIKDKNCNTSETILMPTKAIAGQAAINPKLLERACKGASMIRVYFNPNALNRAFFLELEYKKAATKKRRSVAELEAIIKSLTEENSRLKQKLEGAI